MLTRDEIIDKVDQDIAELVVNKYKTKKAYDYYNCIMDREQFRYLEENFGIGNPTSVKFIPLIKKHIDALVNKHLEVSLMPTISCKDSRTIGYIMRDKQLKIKSRIKNEMLSIVKNWMLLGINGKLEDDFIKNKIHSIKDDLDTSFISEYEIAAQNIVDWCIQSKSIDIYDKRRQLMTDLLVSGECFFVPGMTPNKDNICLEIKSPLNVFPQRNPSSNYVKDCPRIVIRDWMTKDQIINKFGKYLNNETIKELEDEYKSSMNSWNETIVRVDAPDGKPFVPQHIGDDIEITPGFPEEGMNWYSRYIPVYYCEWIQTEKENGKYIMFRYHAYRIGDRIHIPLGRDEDTVRSIDDPTKATLSINGLFLRNRQNKPFSLVLQCADLQDQYNIVHYLKENVLSNSGTVGDWVDISKLPACLGNDWAERLEKLIAYKKQGIALFDSSQDGTPVVNTSFSGFDDTLKAQAIQAFMLVLQDIENTTSSTTGVSREMLTNGIQQYDAVKNIQVGVNNFHTITMHYYKQMDNLDMDMLLDLLNYAKIAYKDGIQGEIILGNMKHTFVALPEHYTMTDFDVHLPSSTQALQDIEALRATVTEFIKSGKYEPDVIMEAMTAKSATEMKNNISIAYKKRKEEENIIGKLQQRVQELEQALQQEQSNNKKLNDKIETLHEEKMNLEVQKIQLDYNVKQLLAATDKKYKEGMLQIEDRKVKVEEAQIYDNNPYNDKIK